MDYGFVIRQAKETDAEAIARLSAMLGYSADPEVIRDRLPAVLRSESDLVVVAAEPGGRVVGWLQAHAAHRVASGFRVEIVGIAVEPAVRRRGVGRSLVAEAERWARANSSGAMVVRSNVRRVESHRFYPALGYTQSKTQAVYEKDLPGPLQVR